MKQTHLFLVLFFCLSDIVSGKSVNAQNFETILKRGKNYEIYSEKNGLAGNLVFDVISNLNGYTWIATNNGLSRFDGLHFVNFPINAENPVFKDKEINKLYCYKNYLYLISNKEGCIRLDLNSYKFTWVSKNGVKDLVHFSPNVFALLRTNGVLQLFDNGKIYQRKFGHEVNAVLNVNDSFFYAGVVGLGLFKYSFSKLRLVKRVLMDFNYPRSISPKIIWTKNRHLNFIGGYDNFIFDENLNLLHNSGLKKSDLFITSFCTNGKDKIYKIDHYKNFNVVKNGISNINFFDALENAELRCLNHPGGSFYWIGTNQGLVKVIEPSTSVQVLNDNKLINSDLIRVRRRIIESPNGDLFFLGYPNILLKRKGVFSVINHPAISTFDGILIGSNIYIVAEENLFITLNVQTLSFQITEIPRSFFIGNLFSICMVDSSNILIGGAQGLINYHIPSQSFSKIKFPNEVFNSLYIYSIKKHINTFYLCSDKGLYALNFGIANSFTKELIVSKFSKIVTHETNIKCILFIPDYSQLWVATTNGLEVLSLKNFESILLLNKGNGLPSNLVTEMIRDNKSRVWLSTYNGIVSISIPSKSYFYLTKDLGCSNYEYNYKSGLLLSNGKIIFGGLNAYDEIDPELFEKQVNNQRLTLTSYNQIKKYSNKINVITNQNSDIKYLFGSAYLQLFFSPFDYLHPDEHQFEYSIEGNDWIKMNKDGSLILNNLEAGNYHIYTRSLDPYGNYIFCRNAFPVIVEIEFYKEEWFLILLFCLVIFLGLLIIFALLRNRQKEERLKSRISMDLHDEIGTIINRSLMMINNKSESSLVTSNLSEAFFSLRIYIKTLKHTKYLFSALNDDLKYFLLGFFDNSKYMVKIINDVPDNIEISSELFRDIRLCVYEISNNTMKYAFGDVFTLSMSLINNELYLILSDNGKIVDVNSIFAKGNGISNIKKRVNRNNGRLDFSINNTHGLRIQMRFKL